MRRARARFFLGAAATTTVLAALAACSLGLDENLIGQTPEAGTPDTVLPDGAVPDQTTDSPFPQGPDASACTKDDDCKTTHGCLKGKCDLSRKACVFDVCRPATCTSATCTTSNQTCGQTATYKYRATQFAVGAPVAARLAAVVYPYLFLGTGNGVVAFNIQNPANNAPTPVPVVGLGFVPSQFVASGSRVYFLTTPVGGTPSRLPLAWIDVPTDPFATKLQVQSALATFGRPAGEGVNLFPRAGDSALVIRADPAQNYPTAFFNAPLVEPLTINPAALTFTANTAPIGVSGTRLVMRGNNNNIFSFGLIANAGGPNPQNLGDVAMTDAGLVAAPEQYAQSADGAVLWAIHSFQNVVIPPNPNPQPIIRALRVYFLLANEAGQVDQANGVDVELYNVTQVGVGGAQLGPAALLDGKTAMIVHAARENLAQTAVQFITREPLGVIKDGAIPRRVVLPFQANAVAASVGNNGIGYVIANDVAQPPNATVYVFDPACAP